MSFLGSLMSLLGLKGAAEQGAACVPSTPQSSSATGGIQVRVWNSESLPEGVAYGVVGVDEARACPQCEARKGLHFLPTPELRRRLVPPYADCTSRRGCTCLLSYQFTRQLAPGAAEVVVALLTSRGGTAPKVDVDALLAPIRQREETKQRERDAAGHRARDAADRRLRAGQQAKSDPANAETTYRALLASQDGSAWDVNRLSLMLERQKRHSEALDVANGIERFPAADESEQVRKRIARLRARIEQDRGPDGGPA